MARETFSVLSILSAIFRLFWTIQSFLISFSASPTSALNCTALPEYRVLLFMDWWPVRPQWPSHGLPLYNTVLHCIVQNTLLCSAVCNLQCSAHCAIQYYVKCTVQCSVWLVGSALSAGNWKLSQGEDWREWNHWRLKKRKPLKTEEKEIFRELWERSMWDLMIGAYYNGPKFKCQPTSGTGWFSFKIWTKNSKTAMVNLFKNLRPFWNYISKIPWEIHFWLFKILTETLKKKII